jgi:uncharacterized protein YcbK (DUF882 family)
MGLFDDDDEDKKDDKKEEKKYSLKELKDMAKLLRNLVGSGKKK